MVKKKIMDIIQCKKCLVYYKFNLDNFYRNKNGLRKVCKKCVKIGFKEYRIRTIDKRTEFENNYKEKRKQSYIKNISKRKEYNLKNSEKISKNKKEYYEKNKKYIQKRITKWSLDRRKKDPVYKLSFNLRSRTRTFFKTTKHAKPKTSKLIGCTFLFAKEYIEKKFTEGMSWENHGEWHIDHIVPLSIAKTKEEIIKLCHYSNLQPLWAIDNMKKGNKILNKSQ